MAPSPVSREHEVENHHVAILAREQTEEHNEDGEMLSVVHRCCCGHDVHKETVVACLLKITAEWELCQETQTFKTTLGDLEALGIWLRVAGWTHAAMESTDPTGNRATTS